MRAAVVQSNYLPWRGYFDLIHDADVFVFYDDVQYTVNDWRNRNRVKTANGVIWITIPVGNQNDRRICDVALHDSSWTRRHRMTIEQSYRSAPYFDWCIDFFRDVYSRSWTSLSELNQTLIKTISSDLLGIRTEFRDSRELSPRGRGSERLLGLLTELGATHYLSGPSAREYIDAEAFAAAGIDLEWKDYGTYPPYTQLHGHFVPDVSIVDLLMSCGDRAPFYTWGYRSGAETAR